MTAADVPDPPQSPDRPRWRRPGWWVAGLVLLLGAGLAWIVVTGVLARGELDDARSEVRALQDALPQAGDGTAGATAELAGRADTIARHAHDAHRLTTGPAWWVAAHVPWVGRPVTSTRTLAAAVDDIATDALPALVRVASAIGDGGIRDGASVDLDRVAELQPDVATAAATLRSTRTELAGLPASTWLKPVDRAARELGGQVDTLAGALDAADTALRVLPTMLGADTPQRYFVAFQNNAEARGTGGLPGAFAIVTAERGTVTFERFESDDTLVFPRVDVTGGVDFGDPAQEQFLAQYGYDLPFGDYRESNESPHFPYSAQIWAAMWQKYSGERITGAVAVDPTALSYLLRAVGPITLSDGTLLDADTIVSLTQRDVYAQFPGLDPENITARKEFLLQVASETEQALLGPGADTATLVEGAARAADERRLLIWSADPAVEAVLAGTAVGGVLPETDDPFGMLVVLNVAGSKLDYYLDRRVTWARTGCGDTRAVTVTVTVSNRAPGRGLPAYVTYRADDPPPGTPPGSNRLVLDWFATSGARFGGATLDGQGATVEQFEQRGHPVFRTVVEVGPGASRTLVLSLQEPAGDGPVTLDTQPLVRPISQTADDACPAG